MESMPGAGGQTAGDLLRLWDRYQRICIFLDPGVTAGGAMAEVASVTSIVGIDSMC